MICILLELLLLFMLTGCGAQWFPGNGTNTTSTLTITTTTLPSATIGQNYGAAIVITGGTAPYKFSVSSGSLPDGLTMSDIGAISGKPSSVATTSTFTVTVTDASSPASSKSQ